MRRPHWQDWVNALLGLWVLMSPWILQHAMASLYEMAAIATPGGASDAAMWSFYIVGIAVGNLAVGALFVFRPWQEWGNVVLDLGLALSPWVFGFSNAAVLMWNAVIVGVAIAGLAAWALAES